MESLEDLFIFFFGGLSIPLLSATLVFLCLETAGCKRYGLQSRSLAFLSLFLLVRFRFFPNHLLDVFQWYRFLTSRRVAQSVAHGPGGRIHLSGGHDHRRRKSQSDFAT